MTNTRKRPFDVYLPGSKNKPPRLVETIEVEVYDNFGEEFLTRESRERIERIKARHMGLMTGEDIKALRQRLQLSQKQLTDLIQCGEKSLSRWENGHGFPTGIVNTLLRLLDEGFVAPASLEAVRGPRRVQRWIEEIQIGFTQRKKPLSYSMPCKLPKSAGGRRGSEVFVESTTAA
jgi:DNA-binding transcriptional regulator YiaG